MEEERKLELQRKIKDAQRREKQKEEDAKRKEQVSRVRETPMIHKYSVTKRGSLLYPAGHAWLLHQPLYGLCPQTVYKLLLRIRQR